MTFLSLPTRSTVRRKEGAGGTLCTWKLCVLRTSPGFQWKLWTHRIPEGAARCLVWELNVQVRLVRDSDVRPPPQRGCSFPR